MTSDSNHVRDQLAMAVVGLAARFVLNHLGSILRQKIADRKKSKLKVAKSLPSAIPAHPGAKANDAHDVEDG